ncbi:MAG: CocE/NonD family hydrolase [Gemmatimonadota bacterium]
MKLSPLVAFLLTAGNQAVAQDTDSSDHVAFVRDTGVSIFMRDSVPLVADIWRPAGEGPFPVLVYRTPYDRHSAVEDYTIFRHAVDRGYAVVIQDVRGRYGSGGEFTPYQNEGRDGFDTIEWAAVQPWSNGAIGTFGLSYPGAVQWLAAVEGPPHLKAMVPAMTFANPRTFFYSGGIWDLSWIDWTWNNIAPDVRVRKGLAGPRNYDDAAAEWERTGETMVNYLPLRGLPALKQVAPWYYQWLNHPPADPWWSWADLTGKYRRTKAAVLNLSGWHDEAYGPSGAIENWSGTVAARRGHGPANSHLIIGPWSHGVAGLGRTRVGERDMGDSAMINYDEVVLRWMDHYLKGVDNGVDKESPVRIFVMGENRWIDAPRWPLPRTQPLSLFLAGADSSSKLGRLIRSAPRDAEDFSLIESDPSHPLTDPYAGKSGAHDYRALAERDNVLTFETAPLEKNTRVVGPISADIYLSVDSWDTDLWVRVQDVAPDGTAYNLMNPGLDVLRASYRNEKPEPELLKAGSIYRVHLSNMLTGNLFREGHRIRVQLSTAFFPWFSRNLHSGDSEIFSLNMVSSRITVYHDKTHPSRVVFPVVSLPN